MYKFNNIQLFKKKKNKYIVDRFFNRNVKWTTYIINILKDADKEQSLCFFFS